MATDLWLGEHGVAEATGVDADTARQTIIAGIGGFATGRFTTPEEVATLITFLVSGRAANITGSNYLIDGRLIKTTSGPGHAAHIARREHRARRPPWSAGRVAGMTMGRRVCDARKAYEGEPRKRNVKVLLRTPAAATARYLRSCSGRTGALFCSYTARRLPRRGGCHGQ